MVNINNPMQEKPIYFYMANLWSEVEKIFISNEKGDNASSQSAFRRAMPIIAKIKSFNNKSASFEIDILQDILNDLNSIPRKYLADRKQISAYLYPFALRAMSGKN